MDDRPRYAIYFVPAAQTDLYRCGSAILGYDCYTGEKVDFPKEIEPDAQGWSELTREPRRYGFHATLKAPFHLRPSYTEAKLVNDLHNFVGLGHAVPKIVPTVDLLGGFVAIVPLKAELSLDALAASCTKTFDAYRAPMSPHERARRMASGLNRDQKQNLDRWGYPYVFAEFRFHMTLTAKVEAHRREAILTLLQRCVRRMGGDRSFSVDRLALVKQDSPAACFRILCHCPLGGRL